MTATVVYGRAESRNLSDESRLPSKVVVHQRSFSIEGHVPSKIIFHRRSSSTFGSFSFLDFSPECGIGDSARFFLNNLNQSRMVYGLEWPMAHLLRL